MIQIIISYMCYQQNFLTTFRIACSALCGALCEQPMHSNPTHHMSLLLKNSQSICSSSYISGTYYQHLPLAFFFSRSLLASLINVGVQLLQCSFSIWSTATLQHSKHGHCRDRQHHTHTQMVDQGLSRHCLSRKRATAMIWSYTLCICFKFHDRVTIKWFCSSCLSLSAGSG